MAGSLAVVLAAAIGYADVPAGTLTVGTGSTLGGYGALTGTVSVAAGGSIAPGSSVGMLSTSAVAFSMASIFAAEIDGSGCDLLDVFGPVSVDGATLHLSLLAGYVHHPGTVCTIINNDLDDAVAGTFTGLPEGSTVTAGMHSFKISYIGGSGNDVTLTALAATASVPLLSTFGQVLFVGVIFFVGILSLRLRGATT